MTDRKADLEAQLARLADPRPISQKRVSEMTDDEVRQLAGAMPAQQDKPEKWPARISMTASPDMKRDLELARLDDGIEVTARLRAMITLWQGDQKLRSRVDKLAKTLRLYVSTHLCIYVSTHLLRRSTYELRIPGTTRSDARRYRHG